MKKVLFVVVGFLILLFTVVGICSGDIMNGIAAILYSPVLFLWDLPTVALPLTLLLMAVVSIYGIISKKYQKYYNWYRNLFILIMLGLLAYELESLFRSTAFFKLPEYIVFISCFFLFLASIAFVAFVEEKKDARYYMAAGWLILISLIVKFVLFVW